MELSKCCNIYLKFIFQYYLVDSLSQLFHLFTKKFIAIVIIHVSASQKEKPLAVYTP